MNPHQAMTGAPSAAALVLSKSPERKTEQTASRKKKPDRRLDQSTSKSKTNEQSAANSKQAIQCGVEIKTSQSAVENKGTFDKSAPTFKKSDQSAAILKKWDQSAMSVGQSTAVSDVIKQEWQKAKDEFEQKGLELRKAKTNLNQLRLPPHGLE